MSYCIDRQCVRVKCFDPGLHLGMFASLKEILNAALLDFECSLWIVSLDPTQYCVYSCLASKFNVV